MVKHQGEFEMLQIYLIFYVRHFETDKIDLKDENQYEYLFNRCLSVVLLSLKYIDHH